MGTAVVTVMVAAMVAVMVASMVALTATNELKKQGNLNRIQANIFKYAL
jgi:type II secretory pathway component PulK